MFAVDGPNYQQKEEAFAADRIRDNGAILLNNLNSREASVLNLSMKPISNPSGGIINIEKSNDNDVTAWQHNEELSKSISMDRKEDNILIGSMGLTKSSSSAHIKKRDRRKFVKPFP